MRRFDLGDRGRQLAYFGCRGDRGRQLADLGWRGQRRRRIERADRMQQQLQLALARHANAIHESMVTLGCSHDEKYADLPE